jgi:uncharacterized protein YkwD
MKRGLIALLCCTLLFGAACQPRVRSAHHDDKPGRRIERRIAKDLVARVNAERTARGLRPVKVSRVMSLNARAWSANMAWRNSMYHSNLSWPGSFVARAENVAWGSTPAMTAGQMHRMWMQSPGHRRNILAPNVDRIGIGIVCVNGRMWGTQQFASTYSGDFGGTPPAQPIARGGRGRLTC